MLPLSPLASMNLCLLVAVWTWCMAAGGNDGGIGSLSVDDSSCLTATLLSTQLYTASALEASGAGRAPTSAAPSDLVPYHQLLVLHVDISRRRVREDYFSLDASADTDAASDAFADAAAGVHDGGSDGSSGGGGGRDNAIAARPWRRHTTLSDFDRGEFALLMRRDPSPRAFAPAGCVVGPLTRSWPLADVGGLASAAGRLRYTGVAAVALPVLPGSGAQAHSPRTLDRWELPAMRGWPSAWLYMAPAARASSDDAAVPPLPSPANLLAGLALIEVPALRTNFTVIALRGSCEVSGEEAGWLFSPEDAEFTLQELPMGGGGGSKIRCSTAAAYGAAAAAWMPPQR